MSSRHVLLIEDDAKKAQDIKALLSQLLPSAILTEASTIQEAKKRLRRQLFDLAIVDMALAGRPSLQGKGNPTQFPNGGLEILRTIAARNLETKAIVITQFPTVDLEKETVDLKNLKQKMEILLGERFLSSILYQPADKIWEEHFKKSLDCL